MRTSSWVGTLLLVGMLGGCEDPGPLDDDLGAGGGKSDDPATTHAGWTDFIHRQAPLALDAEVKGGEAEISLGATLTKNEAKVVEMELSFADGEGDWRRKSTGVAYDEQTWTLTLLDDDGLHVDSRVRCEAALTTADGADSARIELEGTVTAIDATHVKLEFLGATMELINVDMDREWVVAFEMSALAAFAMEQLQDLQSTYGRKKDFTYRPAPETLVEP